MKARLLFVVLFLSLVGGMVVLLAKQRRDVPPLSVPEAPRFGLRRMEVGDGCDVLLDSRPGGAVIVECQRAGRVELWPTCEAGPAAGRSTP